MSAAEYLGVPGLADALGVSRHVVSKWRAPTRPARRTGASARRVPKWIRCRCGRAWLAPAGCRSPIGWPTATPVTTPDTSTSNHLVDLVGNGNFLYVADRKLATRENMTHIHRLGFLSLLPAPASKTAPSVTGSSTTIHDGWRQRDGLRRDKPRRVRVVDGCRGRSGRDGRRRAAQVEQTSRASCF